MHVNPTATAALQSAGQNAAGVEAIQSATAAAATPAALRAEIGTAGLVQAAADAGQPRSASSARRWAAQGRIPSSRVAELAERRAFTARQGGPADLAAALDVSPRTVQRWVSGRSDSLRGPAGATLDRLRSADARAASGLGDHGARIQIRADVQYRAYGSTSDEYRGPRDLDLDLDLSEAANLADALAAEDYAAAAAVIESAWSTWYHHSYGDESGVHMLDVHSLEIDWH